MMDAKFDLPGIVLALKRQRDALDVAIAALDGVAPSVAAVPLPVRPPAPASKTATVAHGALALYKKHAAGPKPTRRYKSKGHRPGVTEALIRTLSLKEQAIDELWTAMRAAGISSTSKAPFGILSTTLSTVRRKSPGMILTGGTPRRRTYRYANAAAQAKALREWQERQDKPLKRDRVVARDNGGGPVISVAVLDALRRGPASAADVAQLIESGEVPCVTSSKTHEALRATVRSTLQRAVELGKVVATGSHAERRYGLKSKPNGAVHGEEAMLS